MGRRHVTHVSGEQHAGDGWQHHAYHHQGQEAQAGCVLQNSHRTNRAGKLCVAQWRAGTRAGTRHHGARLVSGRCGCDRFHRSQQTVRDRVLRSWSHRCATVGGCRTSRRRPRGSSGAWNDWRVVGRVLLQRSDLLVRTGARHGHHRTHAQRQTFGQRNCGRQVDQARSVQSTESAENRVARGVPGGALVSRSTGA